MRKLVGLFSCLAAVSVSACSGSDGSEPVSDPDASASPEPDGGVAEDPGEPFPQDRVATLEIAIAPADWQAMLDDMTDMLGAFGAGGSGPAGGGGPGGGGPGGGGPGGEPPEEVLVACDALAEGDACSAVVSGNPIEGHCMSIPGQTRLACAPDGMGVGPGYTDLIPRTPIWVPCAITFEGRTWEHVGIRFKGNASLRDAWQTGVYKMPFRIKMDAFQDEWPETKDQRFAGGLRLLSLSNGNRDPSLARAKIGNDLFLAAGLPSQRSGFYRVVIDRGEGPTYFGVYVASEMPADYVFLDRSFGDSEEVGNLYQPDGPAATFASWDEADMGKENHETQADFSDLRAFYDALHADRTDWQAFRAGIDARFDVDLFLRWLALNTDVEDWDTYGVGPHNYYLYANPANGGRFAWIPWDHSESLRADDRALSLGLDDVDEGWPIIRAIMDDVEWRARYDALVAETIEDVFEPAATEQRIRDAQALVTPYAVGPEGEQPGYTFLESADDLARGFDELVQHVQGRADAVRAFHR